MQTVYSFATGIYGKLQWILRKHGRRSWPTPICTDVSHLAARLQLQAPKFTRHRSLSGRELLLLHPELGETLIRKPT